MKEVLSEAAIWELLAEEAVELAHAAQKMARLLRGENPLASGLTKDEIFRMATEEYNDLIIETDILGIKFDPSIYGRKLERFAERYKNIEMEDE